MENIQSQLQVQPPLNEVQEQVVAMVHELMEMITSGEPNPNYVHALAEIVELQQSKSRHMDTVFSLHRGAMLGNDSSANLELGRMIQKNKNFNGFITSKLSVENYYAWGYFEASILRLLLACAMISMDDDPNPCFFENPVLGLLKHWVLKERCISVRDQSEDPFHKPTYVAMLKTYATGLLALYFDGGPPIRENVEEPGSGLHRVIVNYLTPRLQERNVFALPIHMLPTNEAWLTHITGPNDRLEKLFVPDRLTLAKLRKSYSIRFIQLVGMPWEKLGPDWNHYRPARSLPADTDTEEGRHHLRQIHQYLMEVGHRRAADVLVEEARLTPFGLNPE